MMETLLDIFLMIKKSEKKNSSIPPSETLQRHPQTSDNQLDHVIQSSFSAVQDVHYQSLVRGMYIECSSTQRQTGPKISGAVRPRSARLPPKILWGFPCTAVIPM